LQLTEFLHINGVKTIKDKISRREFLQTNTALAISLPLAFLPTGCQTTNHPEESFSFGVVADVHYADQEPRGTQYYRHSLEKLKECVACFNKHNLPFVVSVGDFLDSASTQPIENELQDLRTIVRVFGSFKGDIHHVIGNHDVMKLSKEEFMADCGSKNPQRYYSFDNGTYHFVILDANYRADGAEYLRGDFDWKEPYILKAQQIWLTEDLRKAKDRKTVVFVHQVLDLLPDSYYSVKNAAEIRKIFENAGNVIGVIQGHKHDGGYNRINGIDYFTLKAMIEGPATEYNAYAMATIENGSFLRIKGFGNQQNLPF